MPPTVPILPTVTPAPVASAAPAPLPSETILPSLLPANPSLSETTLTNVTTSVFSEPAQPEHPINLPNFNIKPQDLQTNLQRILSELVQVQQNRAPATERLFKHIDVTEQYASNEIDKIIKNVTNEIFNNNMASEEKKIELVEKLLKVYQTEMGQIVKVVADQTNQATNLIQSLNIQQALDEASAIITKAMEEQEKTAVQIVTIPEALKMNINAQYAPIENTIREIREELQNLN